MCLVLFKDQKSMSCRIKFISHLPGRESVYSVIVDTEGPIPYKMFLGSDKDFISIVVGTYKILVTRFSSV